MTSDFGPIEALRRRVGRKDLFVLNDHRAHDTRIVRAPEIGDEIGNDVDFLVRIHQREDGLGHRVKWQVLVSAFGEILDDIRQEDGYAMIIANDPGQSVIVAADKNLDITDRVVSRLRAVAAANKTNAMQKGAPASPAGVVPKKPPTQ